MYTRGWGTRGTLISLKFVIRTREEVESRAGVVVAAAADRGSWISRTVRRPRLSFTFTSIYLCQILARVRRVYIIKDTASRSAIDSVVAAYLCELRFPRWQFTARVKFRFYRVVSLRYYLIPFLKLYYSKLSWKIYGSIKEFGSWFIRYNKCGNMCRKELLHSWKRNFATVELK